MDMKKILQALDTASTKPVEGASSMAKFLRVVKEADINQADAGETQQVISEGANPHKVALPVQMAMQHYQDASKKVVAKESIIGKYFSLVEEAQRQTQEEKKAFLKQYASIIAERVRLKDKDLDEDNDPCWDNYKQIGTKKKGGKTVPNCVPKK